MSKIVKAIGEIDSQISKTVIIELGQQHATKIVENDKYDLMKIYVEFKRYELYLKTLIDAVKNESINQLKEEGAKDFEYGAAKITLSKRRKFDYSSDDSWNQLTEEIDHFKEAKKSREELLKSIEGEFVEVVDKATGELQKVYAPHVEYIETLTMRFLEK